MDKFDIFQKQAQRAFTDPKQITTHNKLRHRVVETLNMPPLFLDPNDYQGEIRFVPAQNQNGYGTLPHWQVSVVLPPDKKQLTSQVKNILDNQLGMGQQEVVINVA